MNFIFTLILVVGIGIMTAFSPEKALSSLVGGAGKGVDFCLKMLAVYAVWSSVLKLWEKTGVMRFLSKKSGFLLRKIFPREREECYADLSVNLSANFLGMGGAGTPAGIRATKNMLSPKNRTMLIVINSTSIQLIPTTIVALRATYLSQKDIILPTLLSTFVSTLLGVLLVKILVKK